MLLGASDGESGWPVMLGCACYLVADVGVVVAGNRLMASNRSSTSARLRVLEKLYNRWGVSFNSQLAQGVRASIDIW